MTLRGRIALIASLAVAVVVVSISAVAYFSAKRELRAEIDASLVERANFIAPQNPRDLFGRGGRGGGPNIGGILGRAPGAFDDLYFQLLGADGTSGRLASQAVTLPVGQVDIDVAAGRSRSVLRDVDVGGLHLRLLTSPIGGNDELAIQIARPLTEVDRTLRGLAIILGIASVGGIGLAAGLGLLVARSVLRPIDQLTSAAEHVATTRELEARIDVEREDEVGRLARSFNGMLAALEQSKDQQHRLVRDASHELRTPLTALRTNIEVLARTTDMPADVRERLMDDVSFELDELGTLVAELVDLATDAEVAEEAAVDIRLDELVGRVVDRMRRRTLRTIAFESVATTVRGRPSMLERAVSNLIDNAHKWSPEDATIEVAVAEGSVEVRDSGPGIKEEDAPYVFDRFYRAADARTLPGSGLGLAIVKQIVEQHQGSVQVGGRDEGGAVVGFEIPALAVEPVR